MPLKPAWIFKAALPRSGSLRSISATSSFVTSQGDGGRGECALVVGAEWGIRTWVGVGGAAVAVLVVEVVGWSTKVWDKGVAVVEV